MPQKRSRYSSRPDIQVANQVADWLLCQSTEAIGISNYQEDVDHDGYDDERTYTLLLLHFVETSAPDSATGL